jgi:hypothetical protein
VTTVRVETDDESTVLVTTESRGLSTSNDSRPGAAAKRARAKTPHLPGLVHELVGAVERTLNIPKGYSDVKTTDEEKTVGDRKFACKKVTWHAEDVLGARNVTVWLCADLKPNAIVALATDWKGKRRPETRTATAEVVGFGSAPDKADWGKKPGDFPRDPGVKEEDPNAEPEEGK